MIIRLTTTIVLVLAACTQVLADEIRIRDATMLSYDTLAVAIELQNEALLSGINFIVAYNGAIIEPVDISPMGRAAMLSDAEGYPFQKGQISLIAYDLEAAPLTVADESIFEIAFRVVKPWTIKDTTRVQLDILKGSLATPDLELTSFNVISGELTIIPDPQRVDVEDGPDVTYPFSLHQNYPNPFNPSTTIPFDLPVHAEVTLLIYDILGREVDRIYNRQDFTAGRHAARYDAARLASGIYFYRLIAQPIANNSERLSSVGKMILVK